MSNSRIEINDLLHTYADAVIHRNPEQWSSTWAEDAVWELGKGRQVHGRTAIVELWNNAMDTFAAVVQNVVNSIAVVDEEAGTATGRSYIIEHWVKADGERGQLLAYYDDLYTRTAEGWRFASRELKVQYHGPPDLSSTFFNAWSPIAS